MMVFILFCLGSPVIAEDVNVEKWFETRKKVNRNSVIAFINEVLEGAQKTKVGLHNISRQLLNMADSQDLAKAVFSIKLLGVNCFQAPGLRKPVEAKLVQIVNSRENALRLLALDLLLRNKVENSEGLRKDLPQPTQALVEIIQFKNMAKKSRLSEVLIQEESSELTEEGKIFQVCSLASELKEERSVVGIARCFFKNRFYKMAKSLFKEALTKPLVIDPGEADVAKMHLRWFRE